MILCPSLMDWVVKDTDLCSFYLNKGCQLQTKIEITTCQMFIFPHLVTAFLFKTKWKKIAKTAKLAVHTGG